MCNCGKKTQPSNYVDQSLYNSIDTMKRNGISNQVIVREATQGNEFKDAIYNGPNSPHFIPSTTGVILSYGLHNYGMGKKGDRVRVHINDINSENGKRLYTVIQGEEKMPEANEFLYAGNVSAEARSNQAVKEQVEKAAKAAAKQSKSEARKAVTPETDEDTVNDNVDGQPSTERVNWNSRTTSDANNSESKANAPVVTPVTTVETSANAPDTNTATGNPSGATANSNAFGKAKSK